MTLLGHVQVTYEKVGYWHHYSVINYWDSITVVIHFARSCIIQKKISKNITVRMGQKVLWPSSINQLAARVASEHHGFDTDHVWFLSSRPSESSHDTPLLFGYSIQTLPVYEQNWDIIRLFYDYSTIVSPWMSRCVIDSGILSH